MKKVLVLFPNDWDKAEFAKDKYLGEYIFLFKGPNLFQFPGYLKLPFFSTQKFIDGVIQKAKDEHVDAVLSTDEYIGAIIAAVVSSHLGLPGADPANILLAQHKYFSRLAQQKHCTEASVNCQLVPQQLSSDFEPELAFPFFTKPVKGTFSLFAKKVDSMDQLKQHLNFSWYERLSLKAITRPFNQLLRTYSNLPKDANFFIAEELIEGIQVTVDGFAHNSETTICGIVDSIMFTDTNIFERFEYPSKLTEDVQNRMATIVKDLMQGIGFDNAQFNVELFYNNRTDQIHIIEINPRLSYQFGDLYENVDGMNTYQILLDLSTGKTPQFVKDSGEFKCTASFVLRTFEGKELRSVPKASHVASFNKKYSESNVKIYGKKGTKLSSEMRAIGSYRYGIVNVGAHSLLDLFAIYEDVQDSLPFSFN